MATEMKRQGFIETDRFDLGLAKHPVSILTTGGDSSSFRPMDGRVLLLKHFQERKNRNPSYSLRAFARDLQVSAAALSQYLSRKRELSKTNKEKVVTRLQFSPDESSILFEQRDKSKTEQNRAILSEDLFNLIGDWVSFAILSLAKTKNQSADPNRIAHRLGADVEAIEHALERLLRMKLISVKNNKLFRTQTSLSTTDDIPSAAIRKYHFSILQKAQDALQNDPIERRDISAMTFPASSKTLTEVKKILRATQNRIAKLAQTSDADDVFVIATQYFALTRPNKLEPRGEDEV